MPYSLKDTFLAPPRAEAQELLDMGAGTIQDVKANFADLWRINRYLGGFRAITTHLYPRLLAQSGALKITDVGTGSGDAAATIRQWADQRNIKLDCYGLDLSGRNLSIAHLQKSSQRVKFIQGDALHLPFQRHQVDYFISCLLLHHLAPEQVKSLLAQTFNSARRGIVMSDLVRGWLPLLAFKLIQPVFAHNFLTRHDGITSIYRAYTPAELRQLAAEAGLSTARVYEHFPWRMTLVADK
jgi:2-polyprenyl-3-methyl-5-hydroxy-6-metoxy-1,4-benzoquinol methylase